jgi:hypothetical protein
MENSKEWFKERSRYLKVLVIEKELGCPRGTVDKYLKGERGISERWRIAMDDFGVRVFNLNIIKEMPVITDVRERILKDPNPAIEIRKTLVSPTYKREKVKILEKVIDQLTNSPMDDIVVKEPVEMGFDMMEGSKPDAEELKGMVRITDNIMGNKKWKESSIMIKRGNGFVKICRYSKTFEEAEKLVIELKRLKAEGKLV